MFIGFKSRSPNYCCWTINLIQLFKNDVFLLLRGCCSNCRNRRKFFCYRTDRASPVMPEYLFNNIDNIRRDPCLLLIVRTMLVLRLLEVCNHWLTPVINRSLLMQRNQAGGGSGRGALWLLFLSLGNHCHVNPERSPVQWELGFYSSK